MSITNDKFLAFGNAIGVKIWIDKHGALFWEKQELEIENLGVEHCKTMTALFTENDLKALVYKWQEENRVDVRYSTHTDLGYMEMDSDNHGWNAVKEHKGWSKDHESNVKSARFATVVEAILDLAIKLDKIKALAG